MATNSDRKIAVENVNHPGQLKLVDGQMYAAMKRAVLEVLPASAPGITPEEMLQRVRAHLPDRLFPGGAKAGWWAKTVQLDLEAKGIISRAKAKPLRLHKT
jgi:Family of unknown function (DUF6958)